MRRSLLSGVVVLALSIASAQATTYYVDDVGGSDSNNGTSPATAWSSLTKVNAQFSSFSPGDSVLFLSGDTWYGQITAAASGSSGSPITLGSYGSGAPPVISGSTVIGASGWSVYSGNIYVRALTGVGTPTQLYVDGAFIEPARFPATGFLSTTSPSPSPCAAPCTVVDTGLPAVVGGNPLVGGSVVLKTSLFSAASATISAYDGVSTITVPDNAFPAGYPYQTSSGWGFYLRGQLWMLQAASQWYYDGANLYLWTPAGDSPANHNITVSGQTGVITLTGQNYITVTGLAVEYANFYDIYSTSSTNITVNNATTIGGYSGVELTSCPSCSVTNSNLTNQLRYGAYVSGDGSVVSSNTIINAGNMLISPDSFEPAGIYLVGKSTTASHNNINNSGYAGIIQLGTSDPTSGSNLLNSYNTITNSCLLLADCAGDYTPLGALTQTAASGSIVGNVVNHVVGNTSGAPITATSNGLYLDNQLHNFTVIRNQVFDADVGIVLNYGNNNVINSNAFHTSRIAAVRVREVSPGTAYANTLVGNVLESLGTSALEFDESGNYGIQFPNFSDYNTYCTPNSADAVSIPETSQSFSLSAWQAYSGRDGHSTQTLALCPNAAPFAGLFIPVR